MNVEELRQKTPGCQQVIHFNNAGAALKSASTLRIEHQILDEEAHSGSYETAAKYASELEQFYKEAGKLLNSPSSSIAFTESATVAWLRAFYAIDFKPGDEVICDSTSYASNYIAFINASEKLGVTIKVAEQIATGEIDLSHLKSLINDKTRLLSITHMPTNSGLVNPAEEIGKIAEKEGILYQLDACQSAGHYPLDVNKIGCHFLSATGRKYLRGPRGTGFLYIDPSMITRFNPLSLDLHSAEWKSANSFEPRKDGKKFETWECNIAAKMAFTNAIKEANALGLPAIWQRIIELSSYLRDSLTNLPEIEVRDLGKIKSGIVTITSTKHSADELKRHLSDNKINTVVAIASGTLLDMNERKLDAVLRVSVHYYNTKAEIDTFVACMEALMKS